MKLNATKRQGYHFKQNIQNKKVNEMTKHIKKSLKSHEQLTILLIEVVPLSCFKGEPL